MAAGVFTDKGHQPTDSEIRAAVGPKWLLWKDLVDFMAATYLPQMLFKFYGKKDGWVLWFGKSGRPLLSLYPRADSFIALVVIGPTVVDKAKALPLGGKVKAMLDGAREYHDGRWLFIPVESGDDVSDIEHLLLAKVRPAAGRSR